MRKRDETVLQYGKREKLGLILALPLFFVIYFLPTPEGLTTAGQSVVATAASMAVLWITEAIPIPATALLPLVLFPLLRVESIAKVAQGYAHSNIFLFMGGFFLAMSMQKWGLHKRIALNIIRMIGSSPSRIVLGFMIATAVLSMWISNTATTMMMYPIGLAIILHLSEKQEASGNENYLQSTENLRTALMLGIAYASSIGGIATIIGTPPNIVFISAVEKLFPEAPPISFLQWLTIGLPFFVIFLPLTWLYLTQIAFRPGNRKMPNDREIVKAELAQLGTMTKAEKMVATIFGFTALAWMSRADLTIGTFTIKGWASLLGIGAYVNDATVAMVTSILLFAIPTDVHKGSFLLDWDTARHIPWGILLLFGGGIALAEAFKVSGSAGWFGEQLVVLGKVPLPVMIFITCLVTTFLTEMTSNTAIATLFMPIMASTAMALDAHPFLLMIPATISASCAFMLPVATPPNAIVFASGYVTIPQMAKAGFFLNIIGAILVTLLTHFVVIPMFDISASTLPGWVP